MMGQAQQVLKRTFGYSTFREGQKTIIESILEGHDTLGIMPTGGGKSICFQIPAMLSPGTALVISPLISLMKDQVDTLNSLGIPAAFINSSLEPAEVRERIAAAGRGEYKLLYIAPERLESERFRVLLRTLKISLLAVDEAHCISQWGHDFRPSYLSIADLIKELHPRPVVTAFTATATESVVRDIGKQLSLDKPKVYVLGFDRANLSFAVVRGEDKKEYLLDYLKGTQEQSGIIYAATRKEVDNLHRFLSQKGFSVGRYHAGLGDTERIRGQEAFLYDDIRIMVATNAFGMGIDKSNVRFVIHYNMPKNMESYYQEAGRAGRDGEPGECILLFSPQDIQIQKFLIEQTQTTPERKAREYKKLQGMVDYCHTSQCLRKYILEYFGEKTAADRCSNCSNCTDDGELRDITLVAQKVFSCIRRMREMFGITLVAEVLKGSSNKKVLQYRFNNLSTYGLLREHTLKEISDLIKILVAEGYIALSEGQYPMAKLQPRALAVLKNEERVWQRVQQPKQTKTDNTLFELLRKLRKEISQKEGVPPYVIFPDSTLREMSQRIPLDEKALLVVSGVGETKLKKYGSCFLEEIQKYAAKHGLKSVEDTTGESSGNQTGEFQPPSKSTSTGEKKQPVANEPPSHMMTLELYRSGKSLRDIAKERSLKLTTAQEHIIRCAVEGHEVDWTSLIPATYEGLILAKIQELGAEKLKPLKEALPDEIDYFTIKAAICKHTLRGKP